MISCTKTIFYVYFDRREGEDLETVTGKCCFTHREISRENVGYREILGNRFWIQGRKHYFVSRLPPMHLWLQEKKNSQNNSSIDKSFDRSNKIVYFSKFRKWNRISGDWNNWKLENAGSCAHLKVPKWSMFIHFLS